jgi:hypothetical protein
MMPVDYDGPLALFASAVEFGPEIASQAIAACTFNHHVTAVNSSIPFPGETNSTESGSCVVVYFLYHKNDRLDDSGALPSMERRNR